MVTSSRRALLSVSDKSGLIEFAQQLLAADFEILSTGGTAKALQAADIPVTMVSDYTGFPEILGGRVKTLHPKVHAGILARRAQDAETLKSLDIPFIDIVAVNLYPFAQTISQADCTFEQAVEQIDIGGPAMLRAAAKNHQDVCVVVDPSDYLAVADQFQQSGSPDQALRRRLAQKAFHHTAGYDALISQYLAGQQDTRLDAPAALPDTLNLTLHQQQSLRYGENPQQQAAFYRDTATPRGLAACQQYQGKPLSYNNLLDADAAWQCVSQFDDQATCVIVKHSNPCGVAQGDDLLSAYQRAFAADSNSAFGGIIAVNQTLTADCAQAMIDQQFIEVIIAPAVETSALTVLQAKPNIRVISLAPAQNQQHLALHSIHGGVLVQTLDNGVTNTQDWQVVTRAQPTKAQLLDAYFAWQVVRSVKSNAIVYAKDKQTLGIGVGQTSRIASCEFGILKAKEAGFNLQGCVLASDAFFPFADSIAAAAQAGVQVIVQPGGAMRDQEVIEAADQHGLVMLLTGVRHFRH